MLGQSILKMFQKSKNYVALVGRAEESYKRKQFLSAFLIQSCLIEAVVKKYAKIKLRGRLSSAPDLDKKFVRFELARMLDDLYLSGKISKKIYEDLTIYRKKRNQVIHNILGYGIQTRELRKELKDAYKLGVGMKGFIVEDMVLSENGKTVAELAAEQEAFLGEHWEKARKAINKELSPKIRELNRMFNKFIEKSKPKI